MTMTGNADNFSAVEIRFHTCDTGEHYRAVIWNDKASHQIRVLMAEHFDGDPDRAAKAQQAANQDWSDFEKLIDILGGDWEREGRDLPNVKEIIIPRS